MLWKTAGVIRSLLMTVAVLTSASGCFAEIPAIPGSGSKLSPAYVRNDAGTLLIGLRPCSQEHVKTVEIQILRQNKAERIPWTSQVDKSDAARSEIKLFAKTPGYATPRDYNAANQAAIFSGGINDSYGVTFRVDLAPGMTYYRGNLEPIFYSEYLKLEDGLFCRG